MGKNFSWRKEEDGLLITEIYHRGIYKQKKKTAERSKKIEEIVMDVKEQLPDRTEDGIFQRIRLILRNLHSIN